MYFHFTRNSQKAIFVQRPFFNFQHTVMSLLFKQLFYLCPRAVYQGLRYYIPPILPFFPVFSCFLKISFISPFFAPFSCFFLFLYFYFVFMLFMHNFPFYFIIYTNNRCLQHLRSTIKWFKLWIFLCILIQGVSADPADFLPHILKNCFTS